MIYSIGFKMQGEPLEYKGQKYMHIDEESGLILKELCGEWPSRWDCRPTKYMRPIFDNAVNALSKNTSKYKYFSNGQWGNPEEIKITLNELIERCDAFPNAVMEVDW